MNQQIGFFSTITFGCKLNQYDSRAIETNLAEAGWRESGDIQNSQIIIINTCTVTHKADADARRSARHWRRLNPDAFIVFTGCYSQKQAQKLQDTLPEVDLFLGNTNKYDIQHILTARQEKIVGKKNQLNQVSDIFTQTQADLVQARQFAHHSRAFVKIQDGCNLRCNYCIVPFTRGKNRSVQPQTIISYLKYLRGKGFYEAVLTGIHIGTYGQDQNTSLTDLLRLIEKTGMDIKIRISSLDCNEITQEFFNFIGQTNIVQPHFHVPLQSGSNKILRSMNRKYTTKQFVHTIEKLQKINSDILIGTDVIVGFPGETKQDFADTMSLIQQSPLRHGHVFSFSKRKGTPAYNMDGQIPGPVIQERSRQLRDLFNKKYLDFQNSFINKKCYGIVLQNTTSLQILTDNYITLRLKTNPKYPMPQARQRVYLQVIRDKDNNLAAQILQPLQH